MAGRKSARAATTASHERAPLRRSACVIVAKACSIGVTSGEEGQEDEVAPRVLTACPGRGAFVPGAGVQDHDLAWVQARHQPPLHKGGEDPLIDGASDP